MIKRPTVRRSVGVAAVAALAIGAVIGIQAAGVSGDDEPAEPVRINRGHISIDYASASTGNNGTGLITYHDPKVIAAGGTLLTQQITVTNCGLALSGTPLLTLTPGGSNGNFVTSHTRSNTIGVNDNNSCGQAGRLVSPNQTLTIGLGSHFGDLDVVINTAELKLINDRGAKAKVVLDPGTDGATDLGTLNIGSPTTNFGGDNNTVFRSFSLASNGTHVNSGVGLQGGSKLNLSSDTNFVDALACGEELAGVALDEGEAANSAVLGRTDNGTPLSGEEKTPDCDDDIGATVYITQKGVLWDNSIDGVNSGLFQDPSGLITIEWAPVDPTLSPEDLADALEIVINFEGNEEGPFVVVPWCLDFDAETQQAIQPLDENGDVVPWCLVSDVRELVDGQILQTTQLFGNGDPLAGKTSTFR